jgi:long-chain acyl-CoA synthetase
MNNMFQSDKISYGPINFHGITFNKEQIIKNRDELCRVLENNLKSKSPFVAVMAANHIKSVISFYSILRLGKICVWLDPNLGSIEMEEMIKELKPAAIIKVNSDEMSFDYGKEINYANADEYPQITSDLSGVCALLYTAAEDGYGKAAMMTEKNFTTMGYAMIEKLRIRPTDTNFALLPLNHIFGLVIGVVLPVLSDCTNVLHDINHLRKLDKSVYNFAKYKVTHFYSVPVIYHFLSRIKETREAMNSIYCCVTAGVKLPKIVYDAFLETTGHPIYEGYGLTETTTTCTWNEPGEPVRIETVGKPFVCGQVKIFDDNYKECAINQKGEICIRGDHLFKGYFNHEKYNAQIFRNGWFSTGDYGKIDETGYVHFLGLKKDMLNVNGINIYPKEVERLMRYNDNVKSVKVSSEMNQFQTMAAKADIELQHKGLDQEALFKEWCRMHLAKEKIPKSFNFVN